MTSPADSPLLEVSGLSKRFGGLQVTDDVSVALRAGLITALVGPNGAGKTTLFNLVTGHLKPDAGDIRWRGQSIVGRMHWQIARLGIARTFQDLRLFDHMSVEDNLMTVMERSPWFWQPGGRNGQAKRRRRLGEVLDKTGLARLASVDARDLGYGERKFLSMARLMASGATVWLLDEPASGLDRSSYERFCALLKEEVSQGVTVCIIEHNLDIVVKVADRIVFLDQGRVLGDDSPSAILGDSRLAAIYFGERAVA